MFRLRHSYGLKGGIQMAGEQTEVNNAAVGAPDTMKPEQPAAEGRKNERSTIEFPYLDLDDAVAIAKAVHSGGGLACGYDRIAAEVKQSANSGGFRLRLSNARVFGLTENDKGEAKLTAIGRLVADPATEPHGRAESFLHVALFKAIYEQYRNFTLPPVATLQREMTKLGVASKQADRARQAFMRSARQAGFFAYGEDKLIRPATTGPGTKPIEEPKPPVVKSKLGSDDGDGGDLMLDPLLMAHLRLIPSKETGWPGAARLRWFRTFAMNVCQIYDEADKAIELEIKLAAPSPA